MFTDHSLSEHWLNRLVQAGDIVNWRLDKALKIDDMRGNWDTINIGRPEPVIDRAVKRYGNLLDSGSDAPAVIVWWNPDENGWEVVDGVQRLLAADARTRTAWAYILECEDYNVILRLKVCANLVLHGGHQPPQEWTLDQAVNKLIIPGLQTIDQIANTGGWTPNQIRNRRDVLIMKTAIIDAGGPSLEYNKITVINKCAKASDVTTAPTVVASFLTDLQRTKLPCEDAAVYIEDFFNVNRKQKIYRQLEKKLKEFHQNETIIQLLKDPSNKGKLTPDGNVSTKLKAAETTVNKVLKQKQDIDNVVQYTTICKNIIKTLEQIGKATSERRKLRGKK